MHRRIEPASRPRAGTERELDHLAQLGRRLDRAVGVESGERRIRVEACQDRLQAVKFLLHRCEGKQRLRCGRRLEKDLDAARTELAKKAAGDLVGQATDHGGVKVLAAEFDGDLKEQADRLRDQLGSAVVVLAARKGDKVQLVAAATKDLAKRVHAGKIIQEIAPLVGGSGGGRPDLAQGGGVDAAGIPAALDRARAVANAQIEASA